MGRIRYLNKEMNGLEHGQIIVADIDTEGEIQARVSAVDELVLTKLQSKMSDENT